MLIGDAFSRKSLRHNTRISHRPRPRRGEGGCGVGLAVNSPTPAPFWKQQQPSPILPVSFAGKLFEQFPRGPGRRGGWRILKQGRATAFSKLIAGGLPLQDALVTSGLIGATGE